MDAEKLNGRFAMMGVMGTTAFELLAGSQEDCFDFHLFYYLTRPR